MTPEDVYELFGDTDHLDTLEFNKLHRIVLGLDSSDLESVLREGDFDVDAVDSKGRTPLWWAASRGDVVTTRLLLEFGASPNEGTSVITGVAHHLELTSQAGGVKECNRFKVAEMLIMAGADVRVKEADGYTPLHAAARHSSGHNLLKMLLDRGIDPSICNLYGQTPLHDSASKEHVECVKTLIDYGADINKTEGPSRPPLWDAVDHHAHLAIEILLQARARLDFVDSKRGALTLLHWIAKYADLRTVELLYQRDLRGLDPEQKSSIGETALDLFQQEHPDANLELTEAFQRLLDKTRQDNIPINLFDEASARICKYRMPGTWLDDSTDI